MGRLAIAAAALWIPLSAGTTWAGEQQVRADPADLIALVRGNNVFAAEISDSLPTNKGSLFFSPYSLHTTLALASAGARQQTESQFLKTLNLSLPPERLHPAVADLRKRLLGDAKVRRATASRRTSSWWRNPTTGPR
jgi:serine protease inhibitor